LDIRPGFCSGGIQSRNRSKEQAGAGGRRSP
jgi:hypothetical protein